MHNSPLTTKELEELNKTLDELKEMLEVLS